MGRYQTEFRNKNRGYMNLIVWQKAMELFDLAWTMAFVEAKIDFKLRAQFADAAQSIAANISEGYGRRSVKEYIQFLYIALGSAGEALTRAIGLNQIQQLSAQRLREFDVLHWIARISEDTAEYDASPITPELHHSITPPLRSHA
jgi:four helix bundle protein